MGFDEFGDWEPDCKTCSYYDMGIDCEVRTIGAFSTRECHSMLEKFDPPV